MKTSLRNRPALRHRHNALLLDNSECTAELALIVDHHRNYFQDSGATNRDDWRYRATSDPTLQLTLHTEPGPAGAGITPGGTPVAVWPGRR